MVEYGLRLTWSIALIAAISFLGFGIQPPNADWGLMINENRNILTLQPWADPRRRRCASACSPSRPISSPRESRRAIAGVDRQGARPVSALDVSGLRVELTPGRTRDRRATSRSRWSAARSSDSSASRAPARRRSRSRFSATPSEERVSPEDPCESTGQEMLGKTAAEVRAARGSRISYVPQDPAAALNPALTIGTQLREVIDAHRRDRNIA